MIFEVLQITISRGHFSMKWSRIVLSIVSIAVVGLMALGIAPTPAFAATTATANLSIGASVTATCIVGTTAVSFGSYSGTVVSTSGAVSVTCTNSTTYTVSLNQGSTSGGAVNARLMAGPSSATLGYALYKDSGMTALWGDGTNSTVTVAGTGNGQAQSLPVYGQIPAAQYPTPGGYSDTVVATVTY
jgi:spore coat protein U-like protein